MTDHRLVITVMSVKCFLVQMEFYRPSCTLVTSLGDSLLRGISHGPTHFNIYR